MRYLTSKKEADEIYLHFHTVPNAASHGIFKKRTVYVKLSVNVNARQENYIRVFISGSSSHWKDASRHFDTTQCSYSILV